MGLPYVPLYVIFPRGKESIALRVVLQKPKAWAYVAEMWCGVAQNAADGHVDGPAAVQQLEEWAGWDGAPGSFVEALCLPHIGLLDATDRGFYVHNWHLHCGLHIEKLKKDRERKRATRSTERPRTVRGHKKDVRRNSAHELEQEQEQKEAAAAQPPAQAPAPPTDDLPPRRLEVVDEAGDRPMSPDPFPLTDRFRHALADALARTAPHPVGGGADVFRSCEAALERLPMPDAVGVCAQRVRDSVARRERQPGTLKFFVAVLGDELTRRASQPRAAPRCIGMDDNGQPVWEAQ